jgi:hypothetical protein
MVKRYKRKPPKGIRADRLDKVMRGPKVRAAVQRKAEVVQAYWKEVSPVFGDRPPHRKHPEWGHPGSYRDSIVVQMSEDTHSAAATVKPLDWKARMVEYGNAHMPEYAPMAKVKAKFRK